MCERRKLLKRLLLKPKTEKVEIVYVYVQLIASCRMYPFKLLIPSGSQCVFEATDLKRQILQSTIIVKINTWHFALRMVSEKETILAGELPSKK